VGSHASTSPPRAGRTLEQIQEEVTLDDVRRSCPAWTPASLDEDWRETVKSLVERSFRGVRGQD
jgi:phage terminase small subunit